MSAQKYISNNKKKKEKDKAKLGSKVANICKKKMGQGKSI